MIIDPYRGAVGSGLFIVAAFEQDIIGSNVTIPTHQAGDLIVLVAKNSSVPALPSGWTSALTQTNAFGEDIRVSSYVDVAGTLASITSPSGSLQMSGVIYRGASGVGDVGNSAESLGTSKAFPALTLANTNGQSAVLVGLSSNQGASGSEVIPAGHTEQFTNLIPSLGGGFHGAWSVSPTGTSYAGGTVTGLTNGYQSAWSIEILAA